MNEEKNMVNAQQRLQNLYAMWARHRMRMDDLEREIVGLEAKIDLVMAAEKRQQQEEGRAEKEKENGT